MQKFIGFFLLLILSISACNSPQQESDIKIENEVSIEKIKDLSIEDIYINSPEIFRDLDEIKQSGVLRAITTNSSTSYFVYRGQVMGYEYELLNRLADHLKLELEIIVARDNLDLFVQLLNGKADLIASGLTITTPREAFVNFTDYLVLSHQVLVQKKPDNWRTMKLHEIDNELILDAVELIGDTISIRSNSSYMQRLQNLMEEMGGYIYTDTLPSNMNNDEIFEMLVDGTIKYTFSDNHIASINASYYPELYIKVPISFSQRIGWATRKNSPELLSAVNDWLKVIKKTSDFNVLYQKYFTNTRDFRKRVDSEFYSLHDGKVSKYDELIKKYADHVNWDWRLICSLIYQESQFNTEVKSWVDAEGLMQLMPATAKELGVKNIRDPEENIKGGTKYLRQLWERWDTIPDPVQRIKFTMASYNCGYYHVKDARYLTKKYQLNENLWDDNVELYILKLSDPKFFNDPIVEFGYVRGKEPFTYVQEIFKRYEHYKLFISE